MLFCTGALHEHSRLLLAVRPPGKAAAPIAPLPPPWRQTVTFDNGTELLHAPASRPSSACIENAIGRRALTDLASLPAARFTQLVQAYNNTPRKCLGYQGCCLECESTGLLSRE